MAWIVIIIAGIFEVVWAAAMKQSDGFSRLVPSIVTLGAMLVSFALLAYSMRSLPLGTAYMAWTGIGAIGAFVVGIIWFDEPLTVVRAFAAMLIVSGLVLLKSASAT
ncbi:MAG: multidrug efflux SMR transporter [Sphingomonadales bacterium]|nr:multidrug efflux SMR transporter [Sphingomonadales bacterium]MDE2568609.1 multidrug efflux SMR transporter [Sphingomonadales bacterium]